MLTDRGDLMDVGCVSYDCQRFDIADGKPCG